MTALLCHTAHSTPPPVADSISCKLYIFSAGVAHVNLIGMGGKLAKDHKRDKIIEGDFVDVEKFSGGVDEFGERKGEGVYCYQNGDIYDGDWKKGMKHGYGLYTYANGKRYRNLTSSLRPLSANQKLGYSCM